MERTRRDVRALDGALEARPEVFDVVRVNRAVNVANRMVNEAMDVRVVQKAIRAKRVRVDLRTRHDVLINLGQQHGGTMIRNDHRFDAALAAFLGALHQAEHRRLARRRAMLKFAEAALGDMPRMDFAADERFVRFDRTGERRAFAVLHRFADTVEHEPRRLLRDAQSAAEFVRRGSVLRVRQEPNGRKPLGKGQRGLFKDGARLGRELTLTVLAAPLFPGFDVLHRSRSAAHTRASNAVRPAHFHEGFVSAIRVRKVRYRFQEGRRLVHTSRLYSDCSNWVALKGASGGFRSLCRFFSIFCAAAFFFVQPGQAFAAKQKGPDFSDPSAAQSSGASRVQYSTSSNQERQPAVLSIAEGSRFSRLPRGLSLRDQCRAGIPRLSPSVGVVGGWVPNQSEDRSISVGGIRNNDIVAFVQTCRSAGLVLGLGCASVVHTKDQLRSLIMRRLDPPNPHIPIACFRGENYLATPLACDLSIATNLVFLADDYVVPFIADEIAKKQNWDNLNVLGHRVSDVLDRDFNLELGAHTRTGGREMKHQGLHWPYARPQINAGDLDPWSLSVDSLLRLSVHLMPLRIGYDGINSSGEENPAGEPGHRIPSFFGGLIAVACLILGFLSSVYAVDIGANRGDLNRWRRWFLVGALFVLMVLFAHTAVLIFESLALCALLPERCFDSEFVCGLDEDAQVVAEDLCQNFVGLGNRRLGTDTAAELSFNHVERRFDVRAPMVVLQKFVALELVVVKHLVPHIGFAAAGIRHHTETAVGFRRDEGLRAVGMDRGDVRVGQVTLIGGNAPHREALARRFEKVGKHGRVMHVVVRDFNRRHDVRARSHVNVCLQPTMFGHFAPVLCVEPASINGGREAGGIGGEVRFEGRKGSRAFLDHALQNRRYVRVIQDVQDGIKVRRFVDESASGEIAQVRIRATGGHSDVNFHNRAKDRVGKRQTRTTALLDRIINHGAQVVEQFGNVPLFV